jgi:hypothetical protein
MSGRKPQKKVRASFFLTRFFNRVFRHFAAWEFQKHRQHKLGAGGNLVAFGNPGFKKQKGHMHPYARHLF